MRGSCKNNGTDFHFLSIVTGFFVSIHQPVLYNKTTHAVCNQNN